MDKIKTAEDLLNYMSYNINPDFNIEWSSQYILETFEDVKETLYGNCWDQVEFEREWFLNNGYKVLTIYEMVKLDYDNDYPTHSFLTYEDKNGDWCWFENADFNNRGIHRYSSFEELIKDQYMHYIEFLKTFNISKEEIDKIVITEFDKPKDHISSSEYLNHVINSRRVDYKFNSSKVKKLMND